MNKQRQLARLYKRQSTLTSKYRKYCESDKETDIYLARDLLVQLENLEYQISDLEAEIKQEQRVR